MLVSAPEDYGLSAEQTLAHALEDDLPDGFEAYWRDFDEEVGALTTHWAGSAEGPVGEVIIPSVRAVRVIGRLSLPDGPVRGLVVTTHGYAAPDAFPEGPEPWTEAGLATLRVRVRGYPPSTLDMDDLRRGWIMHRFPSPESWIVRGAVADVVQACRCAHRHFGPGVPVALHGESLGAALAVMAAARLPHVTAAPPPFRVAIGLPSFGDWRWRQDRYCNGAGAEVNDALVVARLERPSLLGTLLLFDAALHARSITCPVLGKLALRDDVVPAPSAAAVFNGLGTTSASRFVTAFGHFDGGVADARRHVWFERLQAEFLDPARTHESIEDRRRMHSVA